MSAQVFTGVVLGLGALGYVALAVYVLRHRPTDGAGAVVVMLLAVGAWTIFYAVELASHTVEVARVWAGLKFVGIVALVPALWAFVLRYTGSRPLRRRVLALLLVEPVLVLVVLALPATGHLIHYYPPAGELTFVGRSPLSRPGGLFWPHAVYTYVLMLSAVAVLSVRLVRLGRPYRRPAVTMIAAALLPFVGNLVYNLDVGVIGLIDPTPFLFSVTAVVLVWGFLRVRLVNLVPVARDVVVERMADAVVVVDAYGRVVDANHSAERLLAARLPDVLGVGLHDLLPAVAEALHAHHPGGTTRAEVTVAGPSGDPTDLALAVTSVVDPRGHHTASVVVLTDVSERKRTERRLRVLLEEQTRLAETLQQSLRPLVLPTLDGAVLAARWVPAAPDRELSGDFYDIHAATHGRWAFVLGDVSGKGVHAAVVTALARYTVRTLSAQGWRPAQVLQQLNQALLSQSSMSRDDDERFCTVAYGQVLVPDGGGLTVTIALGGHPQPLLRRMGGGVEAVGLPGTALGLLAEVDVQEASVELAPGDLLLVFTDGVTEARHGREEFGEERLRAVLASAGPGPQDAVDAVVSSLELFSGERDDVALLAIQALPE